MATQLQIRRGTSTQVAAFTGAEGEIVVNTTNDSIHVNDGSTAGGFEVARADGSNWAITNAISTTANISFGDNDKAIFGAGSDLKIYHDGSNSYIEDAGTGNLRIMAQDFRVVNSANSESMIQADNDGAVRLYYDNSNKLSTTSTGISVSGAVGAPSSENFYRIKLRDTGGIANDVGIGQPDADSLAFNFTPTSGGHIAFFSGSNEKVRIDSSGNVGIGTSATSAKVIIDRGAGSSSPTTFTTANSYLQLGGTDYNTSGSVYAIGFGYSGGATHSPAYMGFQLTSVGSYTKGDLVFRTRDSTDDVATTERMRIDSSGTVAIGTTSLTTLGTLVVQQSADSKGIALVDSAAANTFFIENQGDEAKFRLNTTNPFTFTHDTTERARIDSSGHLLVGKTSATAQGLGTEIRGPQIIIGKTASGTVNGIYFNHATSYVGGLNYSNTATALVTSSDERLKENIADADDAGSKIDAMQVRKFDWKEDGSHQEYGFVAQELEPVFNHAVHTSEDDMGTKSVDYASLVPMLVKEIQSLRNRVAELENN